MKQEVESIANNRNYVQHKCFLKMSTELVQKLKKLHIANEGTEKA